MYDKHYKEQKMLIENFRKWQAEEPNEQAGNKEKLEEFIDFSEFSDGIWIIDKLQQISVYTAIFYTMGPYLKIAVAHPKLRAALTAGDEKSAWGYVGRGLLMALDGTDNAASALQSFADKILQEKSLARAAVLVIFLFAYLDR